MSFKQFVASERRIGRKHLSEFQKYAILAFIAGILSGLILTGCNTIREGLHGASKDAIVIGHYVEGATRQNGSDRRTDVPMGNADSMELDNATTISFEDAQRIAMEYGYEIN